jgi:valyl-tRNA synthetase
MLETAGALEQVEDRVIATPFGDRSGVVIEPWLTDQWYVDAATLVKPVIEATRSGAIKIVPETWKKTWFSWLENIQPWCVSRQLWWGHRIPALHGPAFRPDGRGTVPSEAGRLRVTTQPFVAETEEEQIRLVEEFYKKRAVVVESLDQAIVGSMRQAAGLEPQDIVIVWRDQDVLDTWFSSALWPFATLGWPEGQTPLPLAGGEEARSAEGVGLSGELMPTPGPSCKREGRTSDLTRHYPNDVLISGFDILFFWDARMAMQGIEFMGEPPWKTLYLHGLVRDAQGQKMSKSKGNTVDPLGLVDRFGADALRFTLAAMESQGRDGGVDWPRPLRCSPARCRNARNRRRAGASRGPRHRHPVR